MKANLVFLPMAASSMLFPQPQSPWISPQLNVPTLPPTLLSCFCSQNHSACLAHDNEKWDSLLKKKVVMRVGYVGTDYRGSSLLSIFFRSCFFFFFFFRLIYFHFYYQVCKCNEMSIDYQVSCFFLFFIILVGCAK